MGPLVDASITNQEYEGNINVTLKRSRHSDLNNVIFLYLNINSIKNKVGYLDKTVAGNIDILCTAETKLDECFPNNQFVYHYNQSVYTAYYRQQRLHDGICYIIPTFKKAYNDFKIPSNIHIIPFEINL